MTAQALDHRNRLLIYQSIELSRRTRADVWIVDGSKLPWSGTIKDVRTAELMRLHADTDKLAIVQVTEGNSGISVGNACKEAEAKDPKKERVAVNIISPDTHERIKKELRKCSIVIERDINERITDAEMTQIAFDACGDGYLIVRADCAAGYESITNMIHDTGLSPISTIVMPAGGGELLATIALALEQIFGEQCPMIIGVTKPGNPLSNRHRKPRRRRDITGKLNTIYSAYAEQINELKKRGIVEMITVSEAEVLRAWRRTKELGIQSEFSAAAAFAGLERRGYPPGGAVFVINTGCGVYDEQAAKEVFRRTVKKWLFRAGIFLAGVALAALSLFPLYLREKERGNYLQRINVEQRLRIDEERLRKDAEWESERYRIEARDLRIRRYANRDVYTGSLSVEEMRGMCEYLYSEQPVILRRRCPDIEYYYHFTEEELDTYDRVQKYTGMGGLDREIGLYEFKRWNDNLRRELHEEERSKNKN